jgi:hypothetical protein
MEGELARNREPGVPAEQKRAALVVSAASSNVED